MATETQSDIRKRPVGIWIIVCIYVLVLFIQIPVMVYAINNHPQLLEQFSTFEIAISFLSMILILVAIVLLFMLKALSFWILLGVTIISFIPLILRLLSGQEIPVPHNAGYGGKLVEIIIWVAVLVYTWNLKSKGILK